MSEIYLNIAVEDELSKAVVQKLLCNVNNNVYIVHFCYVFSASVLKKSAPAYNNASKAIPYLLLTDLDDNNCPLEVIQDWLPGTKNPNFIFRLAVREIEAWLLADQTNLSNFLGVQKDLIPAQVEDLVDPKNTLVKLAARSKWRKIREGVAPRPNTTAKVGPDYNGLLTSFVEHNWDIQVAKQNANSLNRMWEVLNDFRKN